MNWPPELQFQRHMISKTGPFSDKQQSDCERCFKFATAMILSGYQALLLVWPFCNIAQGKQGSAAAHLPHRLEHLH